MKFFLDVWVGLRPYLVHMVTDAIISICLWIFLWIFKKMTLLFPIDGWAGELIANLHSLGAVLAFATFAILFIFDVVNHHTKNGGPY